MILAPGLAGLMTAYIAVFFSWILTIAVVFLWIFRDRFVELWSLTKAHPYKFFILVFVMILFDLFGFYLAYIHIKTEKQAYQQYENRRKQMSFSLEKEYQFGDVLFPVGTKIIRYDPRDSGEDQARVSLTGLERAEFATPINIRNLSVTAIQQNGDQWLLWLDGQQKILNHWCEENQVVVFKFRYERGFDIVFKPDEWVFVECRGQETVPIAQPRY